MFRRRDSVQAEVSDAAAAETPEAASARPGLTPGKGKPTPKRSEAERRRHQPYSAPRGRKAANSEYRARARADRQRKYAAMQRGEDWAMPPRDKGPVKALARDYVDSRRRLSEFYMYVLLVLMVLVFIKTPLTQTIVPPAVIVMVMVMFVEGIYVGRKVRQLAGERLPGESSRGIAMYAAMRALQIRRLRVPKPRIKAGQSF